MTLLKVDRKISLCYNLKKGYRMLITNKMELEKYAVETRCWQGIPSIAVTRNGRLFVCFYSGSTTEDLGNYCILYSSDNDGNTWQEVAVAHFGERSRAFDPCVWIDCKDRLWFFYSTTPQQKVYAVVCDNPDAKEIVFSTEREIGGEVMLNKPTVLSNGEWWLPVSVWGKGAMNSSQLLKDVYKVLDEREIERKAFAVVSKDNGKTFEKRGGALSKERSFDEHMFLETKDGVLSFIRVNYGIGKSISTDGGFTWTEVVDTGWFSPDTRFFITRLTSGNILLVGHQKGDDIESPNQRTKLTAFLSTNGGITWAHKLLLDERINVSYPDGQEKDGYIYVTYDRDRRGDGEILLAKFTEQDIIDGQINSKGYLKRIITKLNRKMD